MKSDPSVPLRFLEDQEVHLLAVFRVGESWPAVEEMGKELREAAAKPDAMAAVLAVMRAQAQRIADTHSPEKAQSLFARLARNGVRVSPTLMMKFFTDSVVVVEMAGTGPKP